MSWKRFENELFKMCGNPVFQTLMDGKGDKVTAEGMELLRKEVKNLKGELMTAEEGQLVVMTLHHADTCQPFAHTAAIIGERSPLPADNGCGLVEQLYSAERFGWFNILTFKNVKQ